MSQTQHTATSSTGNDGAPPVLLALRVSKPTKWALREIAARKKTTMGRLAVAVLDDFVAREKVA